MAIVKMKRLRLMLVRSKKDALLRELARLGCVELTELDEGDAAECLRRESSPLMAQRSREATLKNALALLDRYAPVKTPLLSAKPELAGETLLDESGLDAAIAKAQEIAGLDEQLRRIAAEETRLQGSIESLQPWKSLDLPLELSGTERTVLVPGSLSARMPLMQVTAALEAACEEVELFPVSEDKNARYVLLLVLREKLQAAQECLRGFGFTAAALSGYTGTAAENIDAAEKSLAALAEEKQGVRGKLLERAVWRDDLKLAADQASTQVALAEAEEQLYGTESVIVLEGWCPADRQAALEKLFERYDCAWELRDPTEEEYPKVPVQLRNNIFTNALNMVTNMYSLPAYGSRDPNPLMAPFFILFYGLMMADMGYGILMIAAALVAIKKIKPRAGSLAFCQLLLYGGIATFLMGALTGGFFGNAPEVIAGMFGSSWKGLPSLFSPVRDSNMVLYGSMVLGLLHLNTGMAVNFHEKLKRGDTAGAILEEGSQWVILVGGVMLGLQMLVFKDAQALYTAGLVVIALGVVMLLYGSTRGAQGFGKITAPFSCLYNTLTGWFGDVLSYSRIMALMLAGGVVAQVFNTIAAMPSANGVTPLSGLVFIVVFLIGHALNFALNLLGCFVHDLRLQCLEFFGKFYQDGGKPFTPLSVRANYANPQE